MAYAISRESWEKLKVGFVERTSYITNYYMQITQINYDICKRHEERKELKKKDAAAVFIDMNEGIQYDHSEIKVIIFSQLLLEAVINDYASYNKPEVYTNKKLDDTSFMAKWKYIPKDITGKDISKKTLDLLDGLKNSRKKLVHYNTEKIPMDYEEHMQWEHLKLISADDAYNCIKGCLIELQKIDNTNFQLFNLEDFSKVMNS